MNKILAFFLITIVIVYLVEKGESKEDCESYIADGVFYEAQNCSSHCCGSCKNRYCCKSHVYWLYQAQCRAENCTGYYDPFDNYVAPKDCASSGHFCCGWCGNRYCCDSTKSRINQSLCSVEIPTTKPTTTKSTTTKLFLATT